MSKYKLKKVYYEYKLFLIQLYMYNKNKKLILSFWPNNLLYNINNTKLYHAHNVDKSKTFI